MGFFPKVVKFFDLFEAQHAKALESAGILDLIFSDPVRNIDRYQQIHTLEAGGNEISRQIATQLAMTFITPIDREDIHELNVAQEEVHNLLKAIATRVGLYRVGEIKPAAKDLVGHLKAMIQETGKMLPLLRARGEVKDSSLSVKKLREESEMLLLVAIGELYEQGIDDGPAVMDVIRWTQIYDRIEQAVNQVARLADIVEGVVLKNA